MVRTELVELDDERPDFYWTNNNDSGSIGRIVSIRFDDLRMIHEPVPEAWFERLRKAANVVDTQDELIHNDDSDNLDRLWAAMTPRPLYISDDAARVIQQFGGTLGTEPTLLSRRLVGALNSRFNERGNARTAAAAGAVAVAAIHDNTLYEAAERVSTVVSQDIDMQNALYAFDGRSDDAINSDIIELSRAERLSRLPTRHVVHPEEWNNKHPATTD